MTTLRAEKPEDIDTIRKVTIAAFENAEHSSGTEAAIVDALRNAGALTVSLVAVENDQIVGHVAFSPVAVESGAEKWYGLGPISVRPDQQGHGIGKALIEAGLARLREYGANGCVVLGDPRYYARFGFTSNPTLRYADVPTEYFQYIVFEGAVPTGAVAYHAGYDAT
ncbi:N-acetyltransferase [Rhizobium sp. P40RR-XXII]|uniref:GNAT family N-acetyltransferase n=1 Tax=unclassified Rhizobium TaxID=2613769 RepID=UPI0014575CF0|nr:MULTISPECIES: N-acetyltransferase [unclassified Rhizobium]NLR87973.1 N-acetyltransferase [Rhizobium sp. P28RR-XV]NLS19522.1 N-acetyltransferase [Rhizobium sp. P40RR-XXII]